VTTNSINQAFAQPAQLAVLIAAGAVGCAVYALLTRARHGRDRDWAAYLADASALLSTSIDFDTTVRTAAALPVPRLADWCVLDLVTPAGEIQRRAVRHREPELEELAWRLAHGYADLPDPAAAASLHAAHSVLWREVPDSLLVSVARDEQHLADLRRIGTASAMVVPLRTLDATLGVMALGSGPGRRFSRKDLERAQDLARRCATAIRNAAAAGGARSHSVSSVRSPGWPA
jgi:GAF domain-containing protein